jgi:ATP-binding cassette subfamily B protein
MNTAAKLNKDQIFSMLPRAAKQKLIIVGIGWIIVAAIEKASTSDYNCH